MKKYLLLASTALMIGITSNAVADEIDIGGGGASSNKPTATLTASATFITGVFASVQDIFFGTFVLAPEAADGDQVATLTNGEITPTAKVAQHQAPLDVGSKVTLSTGSAYVTGVNFESTTIDLKSGETTVAQVYDLATSSKQTPEEANPYFWINGKLKVTDIENLPEGTELSGTTTVSLRF